MRLTIQGRYLTPPEVAQRLGISIKKILHWIETAELRAVNTATRRTGRPRWKITPEALAEFERSRTNVAPAPLPVRKTRRNADASFVQFV